MERALILDTEVTGLESPAIVEVAHCQSVLVDGDFWHRDTVSQRYNPGKPISAGAMAVHGITDEEVKDCPPCSEVSFPWADYLIGHNVDFDWKAIGEPQVKRICTLALSRQLWPGESHTLSAMIWLLEPHGVARELTRGAHGAAADVRMVQVLLDRILDKMAIRPESLSELWEASEEARIPTRWLRGKYKDVLIEETPDDYLLWMAKQPDLDPYLAKAIDRALPANALPF
jgi:exodeoxyribonuclease X